MAPTGHPPTFPTPVIAMKIAHFHANTWPSPPPVIPAKAGTQTPVSMTHQPVIVTNIFRFHTHTWPQAIRNSRESGDPGPRLPHPPTRHSRPPSSPRKRGPRPSSPQPTNNHCHENSPLSFTYVASRPSAIPAKVLPPSFSRKREPRPPSPSPTNPSSP